MERRQSYTIGEFDEPAYEPYVALQHQLDELRSAPRPLRGSRGRTRLARGSSDVFFLKYKVKPKPGVKRRQGFGGAYVTCWMEFPSLDQAKAAAIDRIHEDGWDVIELEEAKPAPEPVDDSAREDYDQARIDKTVLRFFTWPAKKARE